MIDERLTEYIKKEFEKGFSEEDIRKALVNAGYAQEIIENSFREARPKKHHPTMALIIIFALIMLLIGIISYFLLFEQQQDIKNLGEATEAETEEPSTDQGLFEMAFKENEPKICSDIKAIEIRDGCLLKFALENGNEDACSFLPASKIDSCLNQVAINFQKPQICEQLSTEGSRQECIFSISVSEGLNGCNKLKEDKREDCYITVFGSKNISVQECSLVSGVAVNYCMALAKRNADLCMEIKSESMIMDCVRDMALRLNDYKICDLLRSNKTSLYDCYAHAAISAYDKELCDKIVLDDNHEKCDQFFRGVEA